MQQIGKKQFASLLRLGLKTKREMAGLAGEYGQAVKDAAEKHSLHKGAFGHVLKLTRMEPEKREDYLRSVEFLIDMARENGFWLEHAGDLADMAEPVEDAEPNDLGDEDARMADSNVTAIRAGIQEIAPKRRGKPKGLGKIAAKLGLGKRGARPDLRADDDGGPEAAA